MAEPFRARSGPRAGSTELRMRLRRFKGLKTRRELRAARRSADAELLRRESPPLRLAWRAEELVAPGNRRDLAHKLRTLVRDASPRYLPTASPVNRVAVRAEAPTLLRLATRLDDPQRPVAPRGILLVQHLLGDGSGPLYDRDRSDDLPAYLDTALEALEAH